MNHLFIIQCHQYEPAIALGNLIVRISKKFGVFYAFDEKCDDRKKFRELPNAKGFPIGYFTVDQGLYHILLWKYLANDPRYFIYDYYHIVSGNDLPFKGILNVDKIVQNSSFYGYYQIKDYVPKGITWYGISNEVLNFVSSWSHTISMEMMNPWLTYAENRDKYTGSFDEYCIGILLHYLNRINFKLTGLPDCLRWVFYPMELGNETTAEGYPISDFGHRFPNKTSPLSLDITEKNKLAFEYNDVLFGRKFEFKSESYNYFYNKWIDYLKSV